MTRYALLLLLLLAFPIALQAQITITSSDIQKPVGTMFYDETTDYGSWAVDPGQQGGPHTWDLSSYVTPLSNTTEVVNPAGTPFAGDFPTANFCLQVVEEIETGASYMYMNVTGSMWTYLGVGIQLPDSTFIMRYDPPGQVPLPISLGSSWTFNLSYADTIFGIPFSTETRSHTNVDAWGTLTIPLGNFSVLRALTYDTTFVTTGTPPFVFADTSTSIGYDWLSKEYIFTANMSSMEGETNPDFTTASSVGRSTNAVGVEGGETPLRVPLAFALDQNFPNPFNPRTEISFKVDESAAGPVELSIYSLRGTKVRQLVSRNMEAGTYKVVWDGKNDRGENLPSGVYLYRLTANGKSLTRKMVLSK